MTRRRPVIVQASSVLPKAGPTAAERHTVELRRRLESRDALAVLRETLEAERGDAAVRRCDAQP